MSIKVYEAYRVAKGTDPFDVLWDIKRRGQAAAKAKLTTVFRDVLDGRSHTTHLRLREQDALFAAWVREHREPDEKINVLRLYSNWAREDCPEELKTEEGVYAVGNEEVLTASKRAAEGGAKPGAFDVDDWMHKKYGEQLTRLERDTWALDVAVTMRRYKNRFYLIPYCDRACLLGGILDFMGNDERLEEFGYWNNTDPPEELSSQQWAWRGTVWRHLTEHEKWTEFVTIDIVSWTGWSDVSPMMDMLRERGATDL